MAQKVSITLVDDIDGGDADETVSFAIDGTAYEIDLTSAHANELREAMALYVGHARKTSSTRSGNRRRAGRPSATGASPAEIRAWARENGWNVPERGRVAADVREAYDAAH